MSMVSAESLMTNGGLRPLMDALRPIVAPGPIVAHWDRLFDRHADRFRLCKAGA